MNWNAVFENLKKAKEELEKLHCHLYYLQFRELPEDCSSHNDQSYLAYFAQQEESIHFDEGSLFVCTEQVYTHLNFAWNSRRMSEVGIKNISERDCKKRKSFPKTAIFADLWPPLEDVNPTLDFSESRRKTHLFPLLPEIYMAKRKLSNLCLFAAKECLGMGKVIHPNGMSDDVWNQRLTENDFALRLCRIYHRLNLAWNCRMCNSYPKNARAISAAERFPLEFCSVCHNANRRCHDLA